MQVRSQRSMIAGNKYKYIRKQKDCKRSEGQLTNSEFNFEFVNKLKSFNS